MRSYIDHTGTKVPNDKSTTMVMWTLSKAICQGERKGWCGISHIIGYSTISVNKYGIVLLEKGALRAMSGIRFSGVARRQQGPISSGVYVVRRGLLFGSGYNRAASLGAEGPRRAFSLNNPFSL